MKKKKIKKLKRRIKYLEERVDNQGTAITCDSCDYHGLSGCGTQCAECPANNKKEGDINAN